RADPVPAVEQAAYQRVCGSRLHTEILDVERAISPPARIRVCTVQLRLRESPSPPLAGARVDPELRTRLWRVREAAPGSSRERSSRAWLVRPGAAASRRRGLRASAHRARGWFGLGRPYRGGGLFAPADRFAERP